MAAGLLFLRSSSLLLSVRSVGQVSKGTVLCRDRVTERGAGVNELRGKMVSSG